MRLLFRAGMAAALALALATTALAGGVPVELAISGRTLWAVTDAGLRAVDLRTGRVAEGPTTPFPFTFRLAAGDGSVWVASVANGFVSGAVSRIEMDTGRATVVLRLPHEPVWDVCANGGLGWAIVGRNPHTRVILFRKNVPQRVSRLRSGPGWCAADGRGVWISAAGGRLLRVDARTGAVRAVARVAGATQLAVGGGNVWVASQAGVARVDGRTGRVQTFHTQGTVTALSVGVGRVWLLALDRRGRSQLQQLDPRSGRVRARRRLPGSPAAVLESGGRVWLGGLDGRRTPTIWSVSLRTLVVRPITKVE